MALGSRRESWQLISVPAFHGNLHLRQLRLAGPRYSVLGLSRLVRFCSQAHNLTIHSRGTLPNGSVPLTLVLGLKQQSGSVALTSIRLRVFPSAVARQFSSYPARHSCGQHWHGHLAPSKLPTGSERRKPRLAQPPSNCCGAFDLSLRYDLPNSSFKGNAS